MQEPTCKEDAQFQNYYLNNYGNRSELQVYCKLKENTYAKNGFYPTVSSAELLQRPLLENKQKNLTIIHSNMIEPTLHLLRNPPHLTSI